MSEELAVEALIQEYIALRTEISQRIQYQVLILSANITLFAAILTVLNSIVSFENLTTLLVMPMISFVIAWLYFEQDFFLTQAATYLHRGLRPAILSRLPGRSETNSDILNWEGFRGKDLFSKPHNVRFLRMMVWFRSLATLGPGIAIILVAAYIANARLRDVTYLQYFLFAFDCAGLFFSIYTYNRVIRMYREITSS